jgi:hypothetical protein
MMSDSRTPQPNQHLVTVEADLAPHVVDLLDTAGIAAATAPVREGPRELVAITVAAKDQERARATLDLVLPGLLEESAEDAAAQDRGSPLAGRLIRRSDWTSDVDDAPAERQRAPRLIDGRRAFAEAVGAAVARSADEPDEDDDFIPAEPPPIPRGDTVSRFAWLGAVGGPILMVLTALIHLPSPVAAIGLAGFVTGFGVLVARMPDRPRTDDGWDDGAVL